MIYIQPFEEKDGGCTWDNTKPASHYKWGALAVRLGNHYDQYKQWNEEGRGDDWESDLEEIEDSLCEWATEIYNELVHLAPDYI